MAIKCPKCNRVQNVVCQGCGTKITEQPCCGARGHTLLNSIMEVRDRARHALPGEECCD